MSMGNKLDQKAQIRFGKRVREVRKEKGMSQEDLALEIGMDLTSINEIEMGHRSPKLITVKKIAKALGVSSSSLLDF